MPKSVNFIKNGVQQVLTKFLTRDLPSIILSLSLFLGGIWILSLRIPGWSLFWGLILIPVGASFTVYALDSVSRNRIAPPEYRPVKCKVCGKMTFAKEKEAVCGRCQEDIFKGILKEHSK